MCDRTPAVKLIITPETPGNWQIRQVVRRNLCRWHAADIELEACLVATELATDCRRRGDDALRLSMECWADSLVIALEDHGSVETVFEPRYLSMLLIEKLTEGWGVDATAGGRRLWAMLATSGSLVGSDR